MNRLIRGFNSQPFGCSFLESQGGNGAGGMARSALDGLELGDEELIDFQGFLGNPEAPSPVQFLVGHKT